MISIYGYLIVLVGLMGIQPFSAYADSNVGSNVAQLVLTPLSAQFETIECARPCKKPRCRENLPRPHNPSSNWSSDLVRDR